MPVILLCGQILLSPSLQHILISLWQEPEQGVDLEKK